MSLAICPSRRFRCRAKRRLFNRLRLKPLVERKSYEKPSNENNAGLVAERLYQDLGGAGSSDFGLGIEQDVCRRFRQNPDSCDGGRGTYDTTNCLNAAENVELVAMGDLFADRLERCRRQLSEKLGEKVKVTDETCFTGWDAHKKVLGCDVD